jgi:hypothetical protein
MVSERRGIVIEIGMAAWLLLAAGGVRYRGDLGVSGRFAGRRGGSS